MFSFVDQITTLDDTSLRGRFAVPESFGGASDWLLAEAIGQLAGWLGMVGSEFRSRPVGATVGAIRFAPDRRPSGIVELAATIERTDRRAILYRGAVSSGGRELVAMDRCIGPLLPMEILEGEDAVRSRFEGLRGGTPLDLWPAGTEVPGFRLALGEWNAEQGLSADFSVAADAALFAEHFPNQPVVPATLLIEAMAQTARAAFARSTGVDAELVDYHEAKQVKVRRFTKPGDHLTLRAVPQTSSPAEVRVEARDGDERVATVRIFCSS